MTKNLARRLLEIPTEAEVQDTLAWMRRDKHVDAEATAEHWKLTTHGLTRYPMLRITLIMRSSPGMFDSEVSRLRAYGITMEEYRDAQTRACVQGAPAINAEREP